jgi:hypothetical protein
LESLEVSKARTTLLNLHSDGMLGHYMKMAAEYLRKVVASHQRDWDARLPTFLLA